MKCKCGPLKYHACNVARYALKVAHPWDKMLPDSYSYLLESSKQLINEVDQKQSKPENLETKATPKRG